MSLSAFLGRLAAVLEGASKMGGSERQLRDVAGVLAVRGEVLDREYIQQWAQELGVLPLWDFVAAEE